MASPQLIIDGATKYGTGSDVTFTNPFGGAAIVATLNSIAITRPMETALQKDASGFPKNQRKTANVAELTCEAQYPTSATINIIEGATFSYTQDSVRGVELWCVEDAPFEADNGASNIRVMKIKAFKLINGAPTVT